MSAVVHVGNVLDILPTLEAGSANCVVTSPPYWGLRDYGVEGQLGLEETPELYVANMVAVFREVRRILRDDGTLWLVLGDSYAGGGRGGNDGGSLEGPSPNGGKKYPPSYRGLKPKDLVGIPWRVAFALQADGWYLRSDIIWSKPNPMPESVTDRPTKAHEYVFLLTKEARYWYDAAAIAEDSFTDPFTKAGCNFGGGKCDTTLTAQCNEPGRKWIHTPTRNRRTVWTIATQPYPDAHFATYPEKLVEPCVLAGCPAQVCSECGAPWERVTEHTPGDAEAYARPKHLQSNKSTLSLSGNGSQEWAARGGKRTTAGWHATCPHDDTTLGTVLDPFTGSGTTGAVACRLGRNFVGIELSPEYAEMAERRIAPHRDQMQLAVTT